MLLCLFKVCKVDPLDLRTLCGVLEQMANEGCDLEVYSKDILMQGFPDAIILGRALVDMEKQALKVSGEGGYECTSSSLGVISVLVQAVRKPVTQYDRNTNTMLGLVQVSELMIPYK